MLMTQPKVLRLQKLVRMDVGPYRDFCAPMADPWWFWRCPEARPSWIIDDGYVWPPEASMPA